MAKKSSDIVRVDNRAILFEAFGTAAAQRMGVTAYQIKTPGVTECIILEVEGQQFVGNVTFKAKKPIAFDEVADVKATFFPDGEIIYPEPVDE